MRAGKGLTPGLRALLDRLGLALAVHVAIAVDRLAADLPVNAEASFWVSDRELLPSLLLFRAALLFCDTQIHDSIKTENIQFLQNPHPAIAVLPGLQSCNPLRLDAHSCRDHRPDLCQKFWCSASPMANSSVSIGAPLAAQAPRLYCQNRWEMLCFALRM
jgi:hypothetical protein